MALCNRFQVFYDELAYEETTESFANDILSVLCDIGGLLGLLLGASGTALKLIALT